MEKLLPEYIDPFRYAEQHLSITGAVLFANMARLTAMLSTNEGHASVHLRFGVDEQKIPFLKGHLEAKLSLLCQRCMEPLIYEIITDFALGIISTLDEADALPGIYEPVVAKEDGLALRELIEDEILLNLPIIPKYELDACKVKMPIRNASRSEGKPNPFHVLESLKSKKKEV